MAYIQPDSTIKLLKNIKLKNDYLHTKYNTDPTEQYNAFNEKVYKELDDQSYTQYDKNILSVEISMADALQCNYIMFKNTQYENKWFYAFVTKIEYVNNNMVYMYYEIDELQTWYFESQYNQCYVEREHTATDNLFEHLVPEDMPAGDYVINEQEFSDDTAKDWLILLAYAETSNGSANCTIRANLCSGLRILAQEFTEDGVDAISRKIGELVEAQKGDSIVALYMTPKVFSPAAGSTSIDGIQQSIAPNTSSLDGYVPKNKKLFNYPYNFLEITNGQNASSEFRYEYIEPYTEDRLLIVQIYCSGLPSSKAMLLPINYGGLKTGNYDKTLSSAPYPICSYATDYYQAWLAQNALPTATSMIGSTAALAGSIGMLGVGVATANPIMMGMGAISGLQSGINTVSNIGNSVRDVMVAKTQGDSYHGDNSTEALASLRKIGFWFLKKSINHDLAKTYDDYLTIHGYKVNTVKVPNPANRPSYTFIKTIGANITGNCPHESLAIINQAHDKGITFWRNLDEIGDYTVYNQV